MDGNGYYAYLPAFFIYHDLHFGFFDEIASREGYENMAFEYRYDYEGNIINKYYAGTAIAQAPFFLAAHLLSFIMGEPMDGYSLYYLVFINIASLFYLMASLILINKILHLYKIQPLNRAISLVTLVFGTNLFYYSVYEPSMSHVYSLAFVSLFVYSIVSYFHSYENKYIFISALSLGIIALIRPANVLVVTAIPFLAGDWQTLKRGAAHIITRPASILFSLLLLLIPILTQFVIYKIQTGHFWVYSYGEERFYFNQPHIIKMLFSYRKGLFIYTPLWFFSLGGLIDRDQLPF